MNERSSSRKNMTTKRLLKKTMKKWEIYDKKQNQNKRIKKLKI